ncbi:MAG: T9SS type A sorting domain-containing protein [Bacteroidetes bacterium]|nr:T9SS type A sorting domain-containing protein [Bacteroidota bacterium]
MKKATLLVNLIIGFHFMYGQSPDIEWQNTIGGNSSDLSYCIQQTSDGGYIIGGDSYSGISGDKSNPSNGSNDLWIVKLDNAGVVEWENTIGGGKYDLIYAFEQTADGGYILGATSTSGISGDKTEASQGSSDYWVIKLNNNGEIEWQNTIGGNSSDDLRAVYQTPDGGYILGGYSYSGISGDKTEASAGEYDLWIIKLDQFGSITWQNSIGGSGSDLLYSIQMTSDGGFIIGGNSSSNISADKTENSIGLTDYWVVKLNSDGLIEWQNTIGGNNNDILYSIQQTTDGGYILGGYSLSGISGDKTENLIGGSYYGDYWVIKLGSSGNILWQNTIGGSSEDILYTIEQTSDEGYILGGFSLSGISGDKTEDTLGDNADFWIIKLLSNGEIKWQNTIGGSNDDGWCAIHETTDGGYIIGGWSISEISADKSEGSMGNFDYWVVKLASECTPEPEVCNSLDDNCNGLIDDGITETISITAGGPISFCQGGSVLLTATYTGASVQWKKNGTNIPGATSTTYNVTTKGNYTCVTTSACGTAESTPIFVNVIKNPNASISAGGPTTFCAGGSVVLTEVAVAGCTYQWYKGATPIAGATSLTYIATTSGNYKCRVTKAATGCFKNSNAIAVSVPCREGELIEENNLFSIYPNPATNSFTISAELNSNSNSNLEIYNQLGQIIYSIEINNTDGIISELIQFENQPSGIYLVKIFNNNFQFEQKLIIQ